MSFGSVGGVGWGLLLGPILASCCKLLVVSLQKAGLRSAQFHTNIKNKGINRGNALICENN